MQIGCSTRCKSPFSHVFFTLLFHQLPKLIPHSVVIITPIAFHTITYRTYIIFACTNFAIIPLVYYFYPETAYRSLEEVDVLFHLANEAPGNPWLNVVKISKMEPLWFGRKGEVPFEYEKSEWHARYMRMFGSSGSTLGEKSDGSGSRSNGTSNGDQLFSSSESDHTPHASGTHTGVSEKTLAHTPSNPPPATPQKRSRPTTSSSQAPRQHRIESSHSTNYSTHTDSPWTSSNQAPQPFRIPSESSHATSLQTMQTHHSTPNQGRYSRSHRQSSQSPYESGLPSSPILDGMGTAIVRTASGREAYLPDGGFFGEDADGGGHDADGEVDGMDADRYGGTEEDEEDDELEMEARRHLGSSWGRPRVDSRGGARDAGRGY